MEENSIPKDRLLLAITPATASESLVQLTQKLAIKLRCFWLAVFVETPQALTHEERTNINRIMALARELGAEVVTTTDDNIVNGLLRVARQRRVTQIILGKAKPAQWFKVSKAETLIPKLINESGTIEVHVVNSDRPAATHLVRKLPVSDGSPTRQYILALSVVTITALLATLFGPLVGAHSTAFIFLLVVVFLALFVGRGPTLLAATTSALLWDFFFLPPIYAIHITHLEDGILLGMYFIVALVLGQLTARIRAQRQAEQDREARATALYLLTRELSEASTLDQMVNKIAEQIESVFIADFALYLSEGNNRPLKLYTNRSDATPSLKEESDVVQWAFENRKNAGKFTAHSARARGLYLPLLTSNGCLGVIGLNFRTATSLSIQERNLLDSFSSQISLALDRHRLQELSEKARLLSESEKLGKTLLNSMSHEIRTPLLAIQTAASNLVQFEGVSASQKEMIDEINDASQRLDRLVGKVLEITRLESGRLKPKSDLCDVHDLVHVAIKETRKELSQHHVIVTTPPGLPLVPLDFVLTEQALTNLLSNAAVHTPTGTTVRVKAEIGEDELILEIADNGPGIPEESLPRIFDKFYRGPNAPTGGTGLGLSLVRGFIEAQGGSVQVKNDKNGGAVFTIRLPSRRILQN